MKIKHTIAALAATTLAANAASYTLLTEKEILANVMLGTDITAGNGWSINGAATFAPTAGVLGSVNLTTVGTSHSTLVGTTATATGASSSWFDAVSDTANSGTGMFTVEMNFRANDLSSGFNLFFENSSRRTIVSIYNDKIVTTNDDTGLKDVAWDFADNEFHTIRVAQDSVSSNPMVHVWIDGVRVSDDNGGVYNSSNNANNRFIFGDTTSGSFGDDMDIDIASISYDNTAYAPVAVPEPSTTALLGLGGLALILRRRK